MSREGIVTIKYRLSTEDEPLDFGTYLRQVGESIAESLPKEWYESDDEESYIVQAAVSEVEVLGRVCVKCKEVFHDNPDVDLCTACAPES